MVKFCLPALVTLVVTALAVGCRTDADTEAERLCRQADAMENNDRIGSLKLKRKIWEELPTTGTVSARECGRGVKERMGKVRSLVAHDHSGNADTVDGCEWAADAIEVFTGAQKAPYRKHWARRLMERCVHVVGRAWTRDPDDNRLAGLNKKLKKLVKKSK